MSVTLFDDVNVNLISEDEEISEKLRLTGEKSSIRTTPRRWFILFMGSLVAIINGFQNLQFAGAENQFVEFFGVTMVLGDLLTQAYYISFAVLAFPVIWLVKKLGLRFTVVWGGVLSMVSATLTSISVTDNHYFFVALVSEFIAGVGQIFVFCLPSLLAGAWFATNEVSTASGTIVFFYQLGNGLALLLPPLAIPRLEFNETLGVGALIMFTSLAVLAFIAVVMVVIWFSNKPDHPPNYGQINDDSGKVTSFKQSIRNLLSNGNFLLHFFSFGIDTGIFSSATSLFKSIISDAFPLISDVTTGQIVAFLFMVGTVAPLVFGVVLDKTKKFLWTLISIHIICIASALIITFAMKTESQWLLWVGSALFGLGFTGKMSVGFEMAAEITYPEPESTSSGLLMWITCVFTTIFIQIMRFLLTFSNLYVNIFITMCACAAFVLTCFMRPDLRRLKANYEVIEDIEKE